MTANPAMTIEQVEVRCDALVGAAAGSLAGDARAIGDELLAMGEAVLEAWLWSKGREPTDNQTEGFRLLALHRQAAKGDPSFNACRETCREIVYHRNLIHFDEKLGDADRTARMGAMVLPVSATSTVRISSERLSRASVSLSRS